MAFNCNQKQFSIMRRTRAINVTVSVSFFNIGTWHHCDRPFCFVQSIFRFVFTLFKLTEKWEFSCHIFFFFFFLQLFAFEHHETDVAKYFQNLVLPLGFLLLFLLVKAVWTSKLNSYMNLMVIYIERGSCCWQRLTTYRIFK